MRGCPSSLMPAYQQSQVDINFSGDFKGSFLAGTRGKSPLTGTLLPTHAHVWSVVRLLDLLICRFLVLFMFPFVELSH